MIRKYKPIINYETYYKTKLYMESEKNMSQCVFFWTNEGVVIAGDTKLTTEVNDSIENSCHKIFGVDNKICFTVGNITNLDAIKVAISLHSVDELNKAVNNNFMIFYNTYSMKDIFNLLDNSIFSFMNNHEVNRTNSFVDVFIFSYENEAIVPYMMHINVDSQKSYYYEGKEFINVFSNHQFIGLYRNELFYNGTPNTLEKGIEESIKVINQAIEFDKQNHNKYVRGPIDWITLNNNGKIRYSNDELKYKIPKRC